MKYLDHWQKRVIGRDPESPLTILCPFDKEWSNFVKVLEDAGHNVIYTHIEDGKDFFTYTKEELEELGVEFIISNPPYSMKNEVLEYLFEQDKPFAMLMGVVGIFESKRRFNVFGENDFQVMYFDKRVAFLTDIKEPKPSNNPPFSSVYIARNIFNKQIVFEEINKKDI